MKKIAQTLFQLFFPLLVGGIVGLVIAPFIDYQTLVLPPLSPPAFLFPVAWSILYFLMGIAYFLFRQKEPDKTPLITVLYYLQLFVNALWSIIFFVVKLRFIAILWIVFLVVLVGWLIYLLLKKSKVSAYLLVPYLFWLFFATYLTIGVYLLN